MTDTVTITTPVNFRAWPAPTEVTFDVPTKPLSDGFFALPTMSVGDVAEEVIDALAAQWLTHLYASLNRANPFAWVGKDGLHD